MAINPSLISKVLKKIPGSVFTRFIQLAALAGIKIIADQLLKTHTQTTVQDIQSHFNSKQKS